MVRNGSAYSAVDLGGNYCIQNFDLERFIFRYTFRNLVLKLHVNINYRRSLPPQMNILNIV